MGFGFTTPKESPLPFVVDYYFVWSLPFDLSGMGVPSRSLAPASIAPRVITGHANLLTKTRWQSSRRSLCIGLPIYQKLMDNFGEFFETTYH
jgi:hypothetical protein